MKLFSRKAKTSVGLDIGSSLIKVVEVDHSKDEPVLTKYGIVKLPPEAIVEEEYQKRIKIHGIRRRPDVIVHVPTQPGNDRRVGNLAVFALKLRATPTEARHDFAALDAMFRALDYPMGAFINIGNDRTHAELYQGVYPGRIHMFAVWQIDGRTRVRHARHHDGHVIEEE